MRLAFVMMWGLLGCESGLRQVQALDVDGDGIEADVDCDDSNAAVYPGATEVCDDGLDNDCDGIVDDEGIGATTWYADTDLDGFGDPTVTQFACASAVDETWAPAAGDCDDADPKAYPGAPEICDGVDQNCDGEPDDGLTFTEYWPDADGDGFGATGLAPERLCKPAPGYATNPDDCDDADPTSFPNAPERCDGADNDCDNAIDEAGVASVEDVAYGRVDDAIVAASALGSATVQVCEGTFEVSSVRTLAKGTSLTIEGRGRDLTTVEVATSSTWLTLDPSAELVIVDLTVEATGVATVAAEFGESTTVTGTGSRFRGFTAPAIAGTAAAVVRVEDSEVTNNVQFLLGEGDVDVTFDGVQFSNNTTLTGSQSLVRLDATAKVAPQLTVIGSTFANNHAHEGVVRLVSEPKEPLIEASFDMATTMSGNTGVDKGTLVVEGTTLVGTSTSISGSRGAQRGGGIYALRSTVTGFLIDDCEAFEGGGLFVRDCLVDDVHLTNNEAVRAGGVALWESTLSNSTVRDNFASFWGGGIVIEGRDDEDRSLSATSLVAVTITDNSSLNGGGIQVSDGGIAMHTLDAKTVVHRNSTTSGTSGPGIRVDEANITSRADFGTSGDPATDNGENDILYDGPTGNEERPLENEAWILEERVFKFL